MTPLRIFIGYDATEPSAYAVLAHSIVTRTSRPVAITALRRATVASIYTRPRGPTEATDFSLTRFLVPYLSGYAGWSLFLDCDMLCQTDIYDVLLYAVAYPGHAVYVCQHDYVPRATTKFEGHVQTRYPRKNWSSVMLFDTARCTALTPTYVNSASGLDLHRFQWTTDDLIGALPLAWNVLVGEDGQSTEPPCLIHYTNGGPWLPDYRDCDYARVWWQEFGAMVTPVAIDKLTPA